ncbi:MAG: hypothetical protein H0V72_20920 [Bradyrhizobium sp.]|nr:hypothetical protein [Bradyrhizobium sp.]
MSIGYTWLDWLECATEYDDRREPALNDRLAAIQFGTQNNRDRRKFPWCHQWCADRDIGRGASSRVQDNRAFESAISGGDKSVQAVSTRDCWMAAHFARRNTCNFNSLHASCVQACATMRID